MASADCHKFFHILGMLLVDHVNGIIVSNYAQQGLRLSDKWVL